MKLLYCEECGDILSPHRQKDRVRQCSCERYGVWWKDPNKGIIRVYDYSGMRDRYPDQNHCWLLGVTNAFLSYPHHITAEAVTEILDAHPDSYLFKQQRSCIVRFRPGATSDSAWATNPKPELSE